MENPTISDNDHEKAKRKAKSLYLEIGRVWCPALGDYVVFNSVGFQHLLRKRGKRRLQSEQQRRFALLKNAVDIVTNPNALVIHAKRMAMQSNKWQREKIMREIQADFWAFKEIKDGQTIATLLVRQLERGEKHFFSIY